MIHHPHHQSTYYFSDLRFIYGPETEDINRIIIIYVNFATLIRLDKCIISDTRPGTNFDTKYVKKATLKDFTAIAVYGRANV